MGDPLRGEAVDRADILSGQPDPDRIGCRWVRLGRAQRLLGTLPSILHSIKVSVPKIVPGTKVNTENHLEGLWVACFMGRLKPEELRAMERSRMGDDFPCVWSTSLFCL